MQTGYREINIFRNIPSILHSLVVISNEIQLSYYNIGYLITAFDCLLSEQKIYVLQLCFIQCHSCCTELNTFVSWLQTSYRSAVSCNAMRQYFPLQKNQEKRNIFDIVHSTRCDNCKVIIFDISFIVSSFDQTFVLQFC